MRTFDHIKGNLKEAFLEAMNDMVSEIKEVDPAAAEYAQRKLDHLPADASLEQVVKTAKDFIIISKKAARDNEPR